MDWAARRRFFILLGIGAVIVAFVAVILISTFQKTPSCTDNIQNQNETGVDCGGSCTHLCTAEVQPPTVLFTKALSNTGGRTDVIASVENKNASAAAKQVPYTITLYGTDRSILQTVTGTFDLPPGATVPVYVPGIVSGKQVVARAFFAIEPSAPEWFTLTNDSRMLPVVVNTKQSGTVSAPRIEVELANQSVTKLANVQVIVLVRDEERSVIAASTTIVPLIPAQGSTTATFTWNSAFSATTTSIEVVPIVPLP